VTQKAALFFSIGSDAKEDSSVFIALTACHQFSHISWDEFYESPVRFTDNQAQFYTCSIENQTKFYAGSLMKLPSKFIFKDLPDSSGEKLDLIGTNTCM
jgi:hypothetical protein